MWKSTSETESLFPGVSTTVQGARETAIWEGLVLNAEEKEEFHIYQCQDLLLKHERSTASKSAELSIHLASGQHWGAGLLSALSHFPLPDSNCLHGVLDVEEPTVSP